MKKYISVLACFVLLCSVIVPAWAGGGQNTNQCQGDQVDIAPGEGKTTETRATKELNSPENQK
ncbi:MAG: hypothetical protein KAI91_08080 [Candidatus Omnitrophica bacterium]|nr:hypothetical protein [Spirochaetota bacterium]MCK5394283.1 hypothetical protein [Candidatus Omnitrophota bacterium]